MKPRVSAVRKSTLLLVGAILLQSLQGFASAQDTRDEILANNKRVIRQLLTSGKRGVDSDTLHVGDMIFSIEGLLDTGSIDGRPWTDGVFHYEYDPDLTTAQRQRIATGILNWQTRLIDYGASVGLDSPVSFVLCAPSCDDVGQSRYVRFRQSTDGRSSSHVGMALYGQTISLTAAAMASDWFTVEHEIGHALGLTHEHSRSDRNNFVRVRPDLENTLNYQFNSTLNFEDYNFMSVMHYRALSEGRPFFECDENLNRTDGCNLVALPPNEDLQWDFGQRDGLTVGDIANIFKRYHGPFVVDHRVNPTGNPPNQIRFDFSHDIDPASVVTSNFRMTGSTSGDFTFDVARYDENTIIILPTSSGEYGETVTVSVLPSLEDFSGNSLPEQYDLTFIVEPASDPVLYAGTVSPRRGSVDDVFEFSVTFAPPSSTHQPSCDISPDSFLLHLDGQAVALAETEVIDDCNRVYSAQRTIPNPGQHTFYFTASAAAQSIRFPAQGQFFFSVDVAEAGHDLAVGSETSFQPSYPQPGEDIAITAVIENLGEFDESAVAVNLEMRGPDGSLVDSDSRTVASVPASDSRNAYLSVTLPSSADAGYYGLEVRVTPALDIDLSNNAVGMQFFVNEPPGPDEVTGQYASESGNVFVHKKTDGTCEVDFSSTGSTCIVDGTAFDFVVASNEQSVGIVFNGDLESVNTPGVAFYSGPIKLFAVEQGYDDFDGDKTSLMVGSPTTAGPGFDEVVVGHPGETLFVTAIAGSPHPFANNNPLFYASGSSPDKVNEVKDWYHDIDLYDSSTRAVFEFRIPASTDVGTYRFYIGTRHAGSTEAFLTYQTITVAEPRPTIAGLNQSTVSADDVLVVNGSSFGATRGSSDMSFGGVPAPTTPFWSANRIDVMVPEGVSPGLITVTTTGGTSNGVAYEVSSSSGAPELPLLIPDQTMNAGEELTVGNLDDHFWDPNGEALAYSVEVSPTSGLVAGVSPEGVLTATAGSNTIGVFIVTLMASDILGKTVEASFSVAVQAGVALHTISVDKRGMDVGLFVSTSPSDWYGEGSGEAPISRMFSDGTEVTLSVPATGSGVIFSHWERDGAALSSSREISFVAVADQQWTAVYRSESQRYTLELASLEPNADVPISIQTGWEVPLEVLTPATVSLFEGEAVVTAPDTLLGSSFERWLEGSATIGVEPTIAVTVESDMELIAVYSGDLGDTCTFAWQMLIMAKDAGLASTVLTIGQAQEATDGLDPSCGESILPPRAPSGFDARLIPPAGTYGALRDLRAAAADSMLWQVQVRPGTGGYPVTLEWDPTELPSGSFTLTDGSAVLADLKGQSSFSYDLAYPSLFVVYRSELTFACAVESGWNMVSTPVALIDPKATVVLASEFFPPLYSYDPRAGTYVPEDNLEPGQGYWAYFLGSSGYELSGVPVVDKSISVRSGWNMVGSFEGPVNVSSMTTDPQGILFPPLYTYSPSAGVYEPADAVTSCSGHWAYALLDGTVHLTGTDASAKTAAPVASVEVDKSWMHLLIEDAIGRSRNLYLHGGGEEVGLYPVPPVSPGSGFDARFAGQVFVQSADDAEIRITSDAYPVRVTVSNTGAHIVTLSTRDGDLYETVAESGVVEISGPTEGILVTLSETPTDYRLYQNYPNPFNPMTTIPFVLPVESAVRIEIFDTLGRRVGVVVNERLPAGQHQARFDATTLSSGLYVYRIEVGGFRATRTMMVVK